MRQDILRVERVEARLVERDWPWAIAEANTIRRFWSEALAARPKSFDGEVLIACALDIRGGLCRTDFMRARYSAFLTWLCTGCPDKSVINGFAMAALQGRDGAFVLGVMGPQTQNAGQIYFAAGTPDASAVMEDGRVDLEGSLMRELLEETHLLRGEVDLRPGWTIVRDGQKVAFLRPARLAMTGEEARRTIRERLAREHEPELSDIALARGPADIDEARMPGFLKLFLRDAFSSA